MPAPWLLPRAPLQVPDGGVPSGILTAQEIRQLTRWAISYHAEAAYGGEDGKKWAFARYLCQTGQISESCVVSRLKTEDSRLTTADQRTTTLNWAAGGGSLPSSALG